MEAASHRSGAGSVARDGSRRGTERTRKNGREAVSVSGTAVVGLDEECSAFALEEQLRAGGGSLAELVAELVGGLGVVGEDENARASPVDVVPVAFESPRECLCGVLAVELEMH